MAGAKNIITQAEQAPDDAAAAQRLSGAKEFLDQASALRPDDPQLKEMTGRYDNLRHARREGHAAVRHRAAVAVPARDGPQLGRVPWSPASPSTSWIRGRTQCRASSARRSATASSRRRKSPSCAKGDPVGDKTVGDLLDMTWIDAATANQRSMLHVMDVDGRTDRLRRGLRPEAAAINQDGWVTPQLMAGYNGNLYVADSGADQVWRYAPTANGYEGEPAGLVPNRQEAGHERAGQHGDRRPDLAAALRRPAAQVPERRAAPFNWSDLPTPLNGPTALALSQDGDRLYVADPGNARIIEATKDGKFLRQFRAREGDLLRDVKDLVLDESKAHLLHSDEQPALQGGRAAAGGDSVACGETGV